MAARDPRRIQCPVQTMPYQTFQAKSKKQFLGEDGLRKDGRSASDLRKHFMSVGILTKTQGSSYIEVGNTKIVCGVFGPKEVQRISDIKPKGQVVCEIRFCTFSGAIRRQPQPDCEQRALTRLLKEALESIIILEKYPKTQIEVFITVIQDGGSMLSNCITAAGLALCNADIAIYDIPVAATLVWHNGILYTDPTNHEEECEKNNELDKNCEGSGRIILGILPTYGKGQVILMKQMGDLSVDATCIGVNQAVESCERIYGLAKHVLLNYAEEVVAESSQD